MKLNLGDIVLVKFPFTNLETSKQRPALVLNVIQYSTKTSLVLISMITSKLDGLKLGGDTIIQDWKDAGLLHPSLLRLSKIATIEDMLIKKKLGRLTPEDQNRVQKSFTELFHDWMK